jgi:hypothetical protein
LGRHGAGLITDGDFRTEPSGHGFDWRPAHPKGIADMQVSGALRVLLSGTQPESCELLRQYVALEPGKWYSLRWEARTRDLPSPTGIRWSAGAAMAAVEKAEDWRNGAVEFKAMTNLMPVVIEYHRPTGQARAEGWIELRKVSLVEKR